MTESFFVGNKKSPIFSGASIYNTSKSSVKDLSSNLASGLRINKLTADITDKLSLEADNKSIDKATIAAKAFDETEETTDITTSLVNYTKSAVSELNSVTSDLAELAEVASSSTLSTVQREAINNEAQALSEEFASIVADSEFGDTNILANGSLAIETEVGSYTFSTPQISQLNAFSLESASESESALAEFETKLFVLESQENSLNSAVEGIESANELDFISKKLSSDVADSIISDSNVELKTNEIKEEIIGDKIQSIIAQANLNPLRVLSLINDSVETNEDE